MSQPAPRPVRRKKPAKPQFTSTILMLEGVLVLFAALTAYGLRVLPPTVIWTVGGVMFVVFLLLSRMVTLPGGYIAGSVAQVLVLACGFVIPMMFLLGVVFIALWVSAYRLGSRIDAERAAYDAAHPDERGPRPAV
ncbi:DUF4233 domain-containing protein [Cellulomonas sp. NPDC089187]|uniref:DUF4233 domain-containing protein n=1 Tax=Cellulomonas sp. NPDC089187 TaxID=3154970 RepID=UPI003440012E